MTIQRRALKICLERVQMNSYELIMKDIKASISKYLECKMIVNPLFAEKKCNDFSISSNHNQTGIQKDAKFSEVYQNICNQNDYLFMFYDGGVIQIDYKFYMKSISEACLIYYPCPNELMYDGYLDKMKTYIRLEYTEDRTQYSAVSHPKAHIHIGNYNDLRIGVKRVPTLSEFMELIMYLNYHEDWIKTKNVTSEDELIKMVEDIIRERKEMTVQGCLESYEEQFFSITL